MRIYALINTVEIRKFPAFDSKTGVPDPSFILQATVTDLDNRLWTYQCSFNTGYGLEALKDACKAKALEEERDQLAAQVLAEAKQLEGQQVELFCGKPRAKGSFLSIPIVSVGGVLQTA